MKFIESRWRGGGGESAANAQLTEATSSKNIDVAKHLDESRCGAKMWFMREIISKG